ncbi:tetratricopeptide repeat protein [Sagittula salina]|uniref:Tetratricopeptide repeat protein n=1 Tax=Sagittula salina TaxID=2820268 RepID=A0A940MN11_9RHOB|nr:tetratricopeptide repeat protein [Sagittula salina]
MSDADSFIEEVTEEVKRDRLFAAMRKYGWIAVLIVLALVGGTAWREYSRAQETAAAQAFGDAIIAADGKEGAARAEALAGIEAPSAQAEVVAEMLAAQAEADAGETEAAVTRLRMLAGRTEVPAIYRQIAEFKALLIGTKTLPAEERREGFDALAVAGQPLRLLAEEQLALIDIETGETEAALTRLNALLDDAEITAGLRQRASQLIVALGGTLPEPA